MKKFLICLTLISSMSSHAGLINNFSDWLDGPYTTESQEAFEKLYPDCNYHGKEFMQGSLNPYYEELYTISLYGDINSIEAARAIQSAHKTRYDGLDLQIIKSSNMFKLILSSCPINKTQSLLDAIKIRDLNFNESITLIKILEKD